MKRDIAALRDDATSLKKEMAPKTNTIWFSNGELVLPSLWRKVKFLFTVVYLK